MESLAFGFFSDELKISQKLEAHGCFKCHVPLHFEACVTAFRVHALAGEFGRLLGIGA
jgi:hypothetical protein